MKEGSAFSLLAPAAALPYQCYQTQQPEEYVHIMMVCGVSVAEAASLAAQGGEVHVGTWERADRRAESTP